MLLQHFIIIGGNDILLYELDVGHSKVSRLQIKQFLLHASLDTLDREQYSSNQFYMKQNPIEKFHDSHIYAYITGGNTRMLALCTDTVDSSSTDHLIYGSPVTPIQSQSSATSLDSTRQGSERRKFEEALKNFFSEVHTAYLNVVMNPFYELHTPITSRNFDQHVRDYWQKYLK